MDSTPLQVQKVWDNLNLHNLVFECLEELLPFFKESKVSSETSLLLQDHPLQEGRMKDSTLHTTSSAGTHAPLEVPTEVTVDIAEATAAVIVSQPPSSKVDLLATDYLQNMLLPRQVRDCCSCTHRRLPRDLPAQRLGSVYQGS